MTRQRLRALYICYLSLDDPLVHTQVLAYLRGLAYPTLRWFDGARGLVDLVGHRSSQLCIARIRMPVRSTFSSESGRMSFQHRLMI